MEKEPIIMAVLDGEYIAFRKLSGIDKIFRMKPKRFFKHYQLFEEKDDRVEALKVLCGKEVFFCHPTWIGKPIMPHQCSIERLPAERFSFYPKEDPRYTLTLSFSVGHSAT